MSTNTKANSLNKNTKNTKNTINNRGEHVLIKVSSLYTRAAIILLALNFCFTGYILFNILSFQAITQEDQIKDFSKPYFKSVLTAPQSKPNPEVIPKIKENEFNF